MDKQKPCEKPAHPAIKEIAEHLKTGGTKARPLALISDSYDRTAVAKELKERMGASIVLTGSLLAAADYDENIPLAALTYVNEDYRLAKTAASMRLLVQIYGHLRKSENNSTFKEPLAVSIMFRDVLMEMEEKRGTQELPEEACAGAYAEEYRTVCSLWNSLLKEQRDNRRDRLAKYAKKIDGSPIAYLHWGEKDAQIMEFLDAVPQQNKVKVCEAKLKGNSVKLDDLWRGKEEGENPGIETFAYPAQTLEEAALASQRLLYSWLKTYNGSDDTIGVLAYDRQLVRRLHSMLLQDRIHLQDTAGWPANNLLVGKALLAMAAGENDTKELLRKTQNIAARKHQLGPDWWKTPRYLMDGGGKREKEWAAEIASLECKLKKIANLSTDKHSVGEWFDELAEQTESGVYKDFFTEDDAAQSLRKLLRMVADEFNELSKKKEKKLPSDDYSIREIKRLLFDALATTSLVPSNNESRIQLVQPGRFTTREFKAVLLAGADSTNLPLARAPQLFNDEVRKVLGLPLIAEQISKQRKSLALMLGKTSHVGAVWHGAAGISPYVELMIEHNTKKNADAKKKKKGQQPEPLKRPWDNIKPSQPPNTGHETQLRELPDRISVSGCVDLLKCPYMYYAGKVLRLKEDESQAIGERRAKYGDFVHEILEKFHLQLEGKKTFPAEAGEHLDEILRNATEETPGDFKKIKAMSMAERRYFGWEFGHYTGHYIRFLEELYSRKSFCHIERAEMTLEGELEVNGQTINLIGKADRIDMHKNGAAIIDVKTGNPKTYEDFRKYPQLPLYMKLYEGKVSAEHTSFWVLHMEAGTISVKEVQSKKKDKETEIKDCTPSKVHERYQEIFTEAWVSKKALPANGVHEVCQYCSYGGLCRKKHWRRDSSSKSKPDGT